MYWFRLQCAVGHQIIFTDCGHPLNVGICIANNRKQISNQPSIQIEWWQFWKDLFVTIWKFRPLPSLILLIGWNRISRPLLCLFLGLILLIGWKWVRWMRLRKRPKWGRRIVSGEEAEKRHRSCDPSQPTIVCASYWLHPHLLGSFYQSSDISDAS